MSENPYKMILTHSSILVFYYLPLLTNTWHVNACIVDELTNLAYELSCYPNKSVQRFFSGQPLQRYSWREYVRLLVGIKKEGR